jgi:hypothetical protein
MEFIEIQPGFSEKHVASFRVEELTREETGVSR